MFPYKMVIMPLEGGEEFENVVISADTPTPDGYNAAPLHDLPSDATIALMEQSGVHVRVEVINE